MKLGHLPVSSVVLPFEQSEILTRQHEEKLVRDVSHHLTDYFPNFFVAAIYELQSLFGANGTNAYIIGGLARDMLLSAERQFEIEDVDIIIEGQAVEAARYVDQASRNFDLLQEYANFGTAKLDYREDVGIDFASTRREIYTSCGALPEVVEVGVPLEEDIIRRDFTINALALSINNPGHVVDCAGGLRDIELKKIRLLKVASFFEDPSRILRAYRYAIRSGFELSEDTALLLDHFLHWMPDIYKGGGERIQDELCGLLSLPESPGKTYWLQQFLEKGVHRLIDTRLPEQLDLPLSFETISQRLQLLKEQLQPYWTEALTWQIYVTFILLGVQDNYIAGAMNRLGLNRQEIDIVENSVSLLEENVIYPLTAMDSAAKLYDIFHAFPMAAACVGVMISPQFQVSLEAFVKYKRDLEPVKLEVSGDDILKLGVPEGAQVGLLLKAVLHAKLQGKVHHRLDELNWLKAQIQKSLEGQQPA